MTTPTMSDIHGLVTSGEWDLVDLQAAMPHIEAEVRARGLREFIEEADASSAVTWAGPGGVKELAIRRHNAIDSAARAS